MMKRIQNKVAESRNLLPFMVVYGVSVWLAYGLLLSVSPFSLSHVVFLVCLALSTALMVVLNNNHTLIRTYSRTVSCTFIALTCMLCFQPDSIRSAMVCLCFIASYLCAFHSYQDKQSPGWVYYAFLCLGLATMLFPLLFLFVPLGWLFMQFLLNSLSLRTFMASLLGLFTPYWFFLAYMLWQGNFTLLDIRPDLILDINLSPFSALTVNQVLSYGWIVVLALTGIIHFWRNQLSDKIRTRQFYGCFIWLSLICIVAIPLLPQHYDMLIRLLIVNASPLIAHFLTLTHTRITDIAFKCICVGTLLITLLNLWMPSLTF